MFYKFFFEQKRGHHRFTFLILTIGCRLCYGNTFNVSGRIRALLGGSRANCEPFHSQDLISNSPDCLLKKSCHVSFENLVLDQPMILWLLFSFILVTTVLGLVLISSGEILY